MSEIRVSVLINARELRKYGHMTNWDDQRFFLEVARTSSLRRAAERLGTSRSTVQRRITALEHDLGVRLFERLPEGYFTTAAGEELQESAARVEAEVKSAERRLAGQDARLSGTIRVAMSGPIATYLLMPDLAAFRARHPEIRLDLLTTYDMPDLNRHEADVALRVSNNPPEALIGRRVLKVARAVYGAEGSAQPTGWIAWSNEALGAPWIEDANHPDLPVSSVITDPYATVEAVRAGLGLSVLPCFIGDTEAGLARRPPGNIRFATDLWVLTHRDLRNTARIRAFTEFIAAALTKKRPLIEGEQMR